MGFILVDSGMERVNILSAILVDSGMERVNNLVLFYCTTDLYEEHISHVVRPSVDGEGLTVGCHFS